jgi:uncharacterized protein (UPF0212 family)
MDLDFKKCPHCQEHLGLTSETLSLVHSKVLFCSWLCPVCGSRVETRTVGSDPEETLLIAPPHIDSEQRKQADRHAQEGSLRRDPGPNRNRTIENYTLFAE